ncbi:T6SS effector phospholipase Tle3 domain-containing protein [Pseudoduganella chitinolytica]|uniref:DUF3274 domain-containing protein n=1 Tax=Pseudoduganella chitinolytica TaxID=34070 RepID=A0ABY8B512_9BURK|nr:DUF3274 domain-containing protein [Pseudoduganella chitinolytica]WEF31035.1 DUF3274 domain-containing protein [Pseudoduganella chitinolytica]
MSGQQENLVVPGNEEQWLLTSKSVAPVAIKRGMPCITILVHGVNDVGEAFANQEMGLCAGLNTRLDRTDIVSGHWELPPPPKQGEKYTAEDVHPDPDKQYFQRKPDGGRSSVIPFYWGFREESGKADTSGRHQQYVDRFGNRIDKRYGKNGGPFANATTNIPDMFGPGFDRNLTIKIADPKDGTHPLLAAPPRTYMVLAAQRLATLLRIVRKNSPEEPVNIIAHSQGCLVTLLAHAMLAKEGNGCKADTVILNNPPYSLEEPFIEKFQTGKEQQTGHAREETLRRIIADYITTNPAGNPVFSEIRTAGDGVVGPKWGATARKERDNRGKLFLYFSPDDATVGLPNIQGVGWWGVYDGMRKKLGSGFYQRLFASPVGANPNAPMIGSEPYEITLSFKMNAGITFPRTRFVNAEALEIPFRPDLGPATLPNGPIDAAIAVTNRYQKKGQVGILPSETPAQAQARWLNGDGENSYHSSIVSNPVHSEKSTAYDVCIGISSVMKDNNQDLMRFLRAVADWRTNWLGSVDDKVQDVDPSFEPPPEEVVSMLNDSSKVGPAERNVIVETYNYYCVQGSHPGQLPELTTKCTVDSLAPFVVSETVRERNDEKNALQSTYGN